MPFSISTEDDPIFSPLRIGGHYFPGIWRYLIPQEFLALNFPSENRSSCMDCPKVCYEGYRRDYRCCTYHPRIPNFLLGLASATIQGRKLLEKLIQQGNLTPEGTNSSPQQWYAYLADIKAGRFGKSDSTLCHALDAKTGLCQIHAFRNGVCSTFFCLKSSGSKGDIFWERLQTMVSQAEVLIAQWALEEAGFDLQSYVSSLDQLSLDVKNFSKSEESAWSPKSLKLMWGDWYGREFELMKRTAKLVSEHREELWDIANSRCILEAKAFDRAMIEAVPLSLKDEIDEADFEDSDEAYTANELWQGFYRAYRNLNRSIYGFYQLQPNVKLVSNPCVTEIHHYHESRGEMWVIGKNKSIDQSHWDRCIFLTNTQKFVVERFLSADPVTVDWNFFKFCRNQGESDARALIYECIQKKFLKKIHSEH